MRASARALRERFLALLHLDDPPWRVALALAVGVFISFTPFLGFQTLLALLVGTVARLNPAVVVTGTWLNLPWFMPFVYAGALKVGAWLLRDLQSLADWSLALLDPAEATRFFGETLPTFIRRLPWFGRGFARLLFGLVGPEVLADPVRAAETRPVFEIRADD